MTPANPMSDEMLPDDGSCIKCGCVPRNGIGLCATCSDELAEIRFTSRDYIDLAMMLRMRANKSSLPATLSNNFNLILGALDVAASALSVDMPTRLEPDSVLADLLHERAANDAHCATIASLKAALGEAKEALEYALGCDVGEVCEYKIQSTLYRMSIAQPAESGGRDEARENENDGYDPDSDRYTVDINEPSGFKDNWDPTPPVNGGASDGAWRVSWGLDERAFNSAVLAHSDQAMMLRDTDATSRDRTETCVAAALRMYLARVPTAPSLPDDWSVDDSVVARSILSILGYRQSPSLEPGDRMRDEVAQIVSAARASGEKAGRETERERCAGIAFDEARKTEETYPCEVALAIHASIKDGETVFDPKDHAVIIDYTNWRGERSTRKIIPWGPLLFQPNEWHPEPQWLFGALDVEKNEYRQFALASVHSWVSSEAKP